METHADIGALLRTAREEMRMDYAQASVMLHIRPRYLMAMEEGRFNELPGIIYIKGYLQAYAAFLELDKDEILRRFEKVEAPLSRNAFTLPQVLSREKSPGRISIVFGLFLAVSAYALWNSAQNTEYAPDALVDSPSGRLFAYDSMFNNGACFRSSYLLYPPCHRIRKERFLPPPMRSQVRSVMDLYYVPGSWINSW